MKNKNAEKIHEAMKKLEFFLLLIGIEIKGGNNCEGRKNKGYSRKGNKKGFEG